MGSLMRSLMEFALEVLLWHSHEVCLRNSLMEFLCRIRSRKFSCRILLLSLLECSSKDR